jgi:phenylpropionate dioxygenase-like ring-hydroxylating dioxygenase large terminal subunit
MTFPAHLRSYWHVACLSRQLGRRPLARTLLGQHLVLFRDASGQPAALEDRCPHRNAPLSQGRVRQDHLACPYHGWEFDRAGECRAIPGKCGTIEHPGRCVPVFPVIEDGPFLWVQPTPGATSAGPPPRRHLVELPGYTALVRSFPLQAPLLDALENFLDGTHTHFVHAGLVRSAAIRKVVRVTIRRGADQVEAEYRDEGQQSGLITRLFAGNVTHSFGRFLLPATVQLEYFAEARIVSRITLYFTPRDEDRQEVFAVLSARAPRWLGWLLSIPLGWLLGRVVRQDQRILALQQANVARFGGEHYTSTELDLLRPHIARLLLHGPLPVEAASAKQLTMLL